MRDNGTGVYIKATNISIKNIFTMKQVYDIQKEVDMSRTSPILQQLWTCAVQRGLLLVAPDASTEKRIQREITRHKREKIQLRALLDGELKGSGRQMKKNVYDEGWDDDCWIKVFPRMYARSQWWERLSLLVKHQMLIRTYVHVHPQAVLAGHSALVALGLPVREARLRELNVTLACQSQHACASSRRVKRVNVKSLAQDVRVCGWGLVLCVERIILDYMRRMSFPEAIELVYEACKRRLTSLEQIKHYMEVHRHVKGIVNLRALLHHIQLGVDHAGEAILAAYITHKGYPRPQVQKRFENVRYPDSPYLADFCWKTGEDTYAVLELDGILAKRVKQAETPEQAAWTVQKEVERAHALMEQGVRQIKHITFDALHVRGVLESVLNSMGLQARKIPQRLLFRKFKVKRRVSC